MKMISYGAKCLFLRQCSVSGLWELLDQAKIWSLPLNINGITVEGLDTSRFCARFKSLEGEVLGIFRILGGLQGTP